MGNRANYIIKKDKSFDIYYTHWRAINVAQDLTLGQKQFTQLVKEFDKSDELLNEPWIEACVLLDFDSKKLTFWESEMLFETSIRDEYLNQLKSIWENWTIDFAENEMYSIESELKIEYTSKQEIDLEFCSIDDLSNKSDSENYFSCLVVIKEDHQNHIKYVNGGQDDQIALIGEPVINKLRTLQKREPKKENSITQQKNKIVEQLNLTLEELKYFVFTGQIKNQAYNTKIPIYILSKKGKIKDIAKASDQLNLQALTKPVVKYFICYPKYRANAS